MVIAGVDCHKDTHTIVFLNELGQVEQELSIAATARGYTKAIEVSRRFGDVPGVLRVAVRMARFLRRAWLLSVRRCTRYRAFSPSDTASTRAAAASLTRSTRGRLPRLYYARPTAYRCTASPSSNTRCACDTTAGIVWSVSGQKPSIAYTMPPYGWESSLFPTA